MRKAFIFDLDGTLIDTAGVVLDSVNFALEPWNISLDHKGIETIRERCTDKLFDGFGLSVEQQKESFERLKNHTLSNLQKNKLFKGMREILELLNEKGFKIGLWTGRDSASAKLLVRYLKIGSFFLGIVGNTDVAQNKPHPEGLQIVLNQLGVHPANAVMVGDHDHDLIGGKRLGIETIRVNWSRSPRFELGTIHADWTFNEAQDLHDWIVSWSSN